MSGGTHSARQVTVRTVGPQDAAATAELLNAIIAHGGYTVMTERISAMAQAHYIENFPPRGVFHVAAAGGAALGLQSVEPVAPDTPALAHVGDVATFVALAALRRGVGRTLMTATEKAARRGGFEKLMATVRADNPGAQRFYATQGFVEIGTARRHARIRGHYVDALIMERQLV